MITLLRKIRFIIARRLSRLERVILGFLVVIFCVSLLMTLRNIVAAQSVVVPKVAGEYREGVVGSPGRFNPLWAPLNAQDLTVTSLVYASLFEPDGRGGYQPVLAQDFSADDKFVTWTVKLRDGIKWHDSMPLTAGDVRFTLSLIQDPRLSSPLFSSFSGVSVEEIDVRTLKFTLDEGLAGFINALSYLRPLPRHIWETLPSANLPLAEYNIKPVGSGPWRFKELVKTPSGKIEAVELERNPDFFFDGPYLRYLTLRFYDDWSSAKQALKEGLINGVAGFPPQELEAVLAFKGMLHQVELPRSFAVFINPANKTFLKDASTREALSMALNREILVNDVYKGHARSLYDPFGIKRANGEGSAEAVQRAKNLLEVAGWKDENGDGIYERTVAVPSPRSRRVSKASEDLTFKLSLPDVPEIVEMGKKIREQWRAIGVGVELDVKEMAQLEREVIEPRNYEALLFGQTLLYDYNPFPFWHSSQAGPGHPDLAEWQDAESDRLIEEFQRTRDRNEQELILRTLAERFAQGNAAVFLVNPYELWMVDPGLKGMPESIFLPNFSLRFVSSAGWYRETERVWRTRANESKAIK